MSHPVLAAFPRRPLELRKPRVFSWYTLFAAVLFGGLLIADGVYIVPPMIDDWRLRDAPVLASDADMPGQGQCTTRAVITECEFDLSYRTAQGATLRSHQHLVTLLSKVNTALPLQVRYDPGSPGHVSSSWGLDLIANRVFAQLAVVGICVALLFAASRFQSNTLKQRRKRAAIGRAPRAVAAALLGAPGRAGQIDFRWTDPDNDTQRTDSTAFDAGVEPYWLDADRRWMLALAGPDGRAELLDSQLRDVALTGDERAALAQARRQVALAATPG